MTGTGCTFAGGTISGVTLTGTVTGTGATIKNLTLSGTITGLDLTGLTDCTMDGTFTGTTATLVNGTSKYAIPSDALTINRIEVLSAEGDYYKLSPITEREIGQSIDEFFQTDGIPQYYRLVGRTVELFPAPATGQVTMAAGLKVYFDRTGVAFESTDTTETPGFSAEYHDLVPIKASIKWLQVHKPDSPTLILLQNNEIKRESQLKEFEVGKFKDREPFVMRGARNNAR
jgi:hypothetical protein